jgi:hypothetical protein
LHHILLVPVVSVYCHHFIAHFCRYVICASSNVDIIIEATAIQPEAFRNNNYDDGQMNDDLNKNGEIAD